MRLRSQLALGFLVLAVLPLAGIVLYTYASSLGAVRRALEAEAASLAGDMDGRMALVRQDLAFRMARIELPPHSGAAGEDGFAVRVLREIAPVAPFVESLEFVPAQLARLGLDEIDARADAESRSVPGRDGAGAAAIPADGFEVERTAATPRTPPPAPTPAAAPTPAVSRRPVRVDVQQIVRQAQLTGRPLPEEAQRQIAGGAAEAARASMEIAAANFSMAFAESYDEDAVEQRVAAIVREVEEQARLAERAAGEIDDGELELAGVGRAVALPRTAGSGGHAAARPTPEQRSRVDGHGGSPHGPASVPRLSSAAGADRGDKAVCKVEVPVRENGEVVGHLKALLSASLLQRLLSQVAVEEGDIPFAIDSSGGIHLVDEAVRDELVELGLADLGHAGLGAGGRRVIGDWVVATAHDVDTKLTFGVARPMRGALAEVRRSAARNFAFGLGFVVLTGLAVPVMSRRLSRQVGVLTEGAQRIARGDLTTRLPVASGNEIGELAAAFNHMAHDLSEHQGREVEERLLRADHARKSADLEEARTFQLSLLPRTLPAGDGFELAVFTRTAAEVGGDFYDFDLAADGTLTVAVGDATGHGARAGTMVAVTKSLFSTYTPDAGPAEFLGRAGQAVRRMELGRMGMALLVARLSPPGDGPRRLAVATAGMPPVLVLRRGRVVESDGDSPSVEEVYAPGMPLGGLDTHYVETTVEVAAGDLVVLTTDGFPELADSAGEPLGYPELRRLVATAPAASPDEVVRHLAAAVTARTAGGPPADDVTFVVVRVR